MRRVITGLLSVAATMALAVSLAYAQGPPALGKKADVEFTKPTHVGTAVLAPGHYRLQHQLLDGEHYLVVRAQETQHDPAWWGTYRHSAGATKGEVARVACRVTPKDEKQRATVMAVKRNADGSQTIVEIGIAGEAGVHVLLEPQG